MAPAFRRKNYGRWTTNSYCLAGDDRNAIAYSMPLILPDGTVYGVVGVELLTEYLKNQAALHRAGRGQSRHLFYRIHHR